MKHRVKIAAALALSATLSGGALGVAVQQAEAVTPSPKIIGGQKQQSNPWVFQLTTIMDRSTGSTSGCTAEALNDHWILTAKHCVLRDYLDDSTVIGATDAYVVRSNDTADEQDLSKRVNTDQIEIWDSGDLALLHVASSSRLSAYPTIAASYTPDTNDTGLVQGYGWRNECNEELPDWLYKAQVSVLGTAKDARGAEAVHLKGIDGITNHGDSGGPFTLANNPSAIIGIASTIDESNCPANDVHGATKYTNVTLSAPRTWIQSISGS